MSLLLPIFPLDLVMLPGMLLPLHIFEPRYQEMVAECMENKRPFGIVRARPEEIASLGCTADILSLVKTYDDGQLDILTRGQQIFELLEMNEERAFLRAEVLYLHDDASRATREQCVRACDLHSQILTLATGEVGTPAPDSPQLSFQLASSLPLDPELKQALLAMRSEMDRLGALTAYLENILPGLRHTIRARQKAGGNGHAH